jgi:hypothetical protein
MFEVSQPGADFNRAPKCILNRINHLRDINCYFPQRWDSTEWQYEYDEKTSGVQAGVRPVKRS